MHEFVGIIEMNIIIFRTNCAPGEISLHKVEVNLRSRFSLTFVVFISNRRGN